MATIDSTGFGPDSYDDLVIYFTDLYQQAYGQNIRVDARSAVGAQIQILSLALAEQNDHAEYINQGLNPQTAAGVALSNLVLNAGIQRTEDASSTVTLTCTANAAGATIPAGSLVSDPSANIQWSTAAQVIVAASSTNTVSATATTIGANSAAAGTITKIDTPVYGWTTVTNAAAANEGATEETDGVLRLRFQTVVEGASTVSVGAVFQAISDLDGVDNVKVVANNTTSTDANGVPRQHLWCIVDGGTNADIAEAIFDHTAGGIGWHGDTTVTHTDSTTGDDYDVKFERHDDVDIYVAITIVPDTDYPTDGDDQIKAAVVAYINSLDLGDDVLLSRVYTPVNSVIGHYITSLYIGLSATPTGTSNLDINLDEQAVTATAKVTVTS